MRCSAIVALALALVVSAQDNQRNRNGQNNNNGGNGGGNGGAAAAATGAGTGGAAAAPAAAAGGAAANNGDLQASLTLDPSLIGPNLALTGQETPAAGQVESLTSKNNFINFCVKFLPGTPITNGKQVESGSCNPVPMGQIPGTDKMPSAKFAFPKNGDTIKANTAFTVQMGIRNLVTGNFVNAQSNYFSAPQQLEGGTILGHSHVVIELLKDGLAQTAPTDPKVFAFFKGLNGKAANGLLTADVTKGLPAGVYRMSSINTAANHQPAVGPIAQHGSFDDCSYFTVTEDGVAAGGAAAGAVAGGAAAAGAGAANGAAAGAANGAAAGAANGAAAAGAAAAPAAGGAAAAGAATGGANNASNGGAAGGNNGGRNGGSNNGGRNGGSRFGRNRRMFPSRLSF